MVEQAGGIPAVVVGKSDDLPRRVAEAYVAGPREPRLRTQMKDPVRVASPLEIWKQAVVRVLAGGKRRSHQA